jgi:hypothetical protein
MIDHLFYSKNSITILTKLFGFGSVSFVVSHLTECFNNTIEVRAVGLEVLLCSCHRSQSIGLCCFMIFEFPSL